MGARMARLVVVAVALAALHATVGLARAAEALHPVGLRQIEYADPAQPDRLVALSLLYPAQPPGPDAAPLRLPFFTNLHLYRDAPIVADSLRRPLVVFSHGRGSNGLYYAWFGEYLAARGYMVAMINHYRANSFDGTVLYYYSKLWQRPRDISMIITALLQDGTVGPHLDPERIGVSGHSQGGFTSLWIGGAVINPEKFLTFQRRWASNPLLPPSIRAELPIDAGPALDVRDPRVKAVFAMAPGDFPGFGMDADGLRQLAIPTYIMVGDIDSQTPPKDNAELAAANVPGATLDASATRDPDGNKLSYQWFHYEEAGFVPGANLAAVTIAQANTAKATVTATSACRPVWRPMNRPCPTGVAHIILAVTDQGTPALTRYQRVIVTVYP